MSAPWLLHPEATIRNLAASHGVEYTDSVKAFLAALAALPPQPPRAAAAAAALARLLACVRAEAAAAADALGAAVASCCVCAASDTRLPTVHFQLAARDGPPVPELVVLVDGRYAEGGVGLTVTTRGAGGARALQPFRVAEQFLFRWCRERGWQVSISQLLHEWARLVEEARERARPRPGDAD